MYIIKNIKEEVKKRLKYDKTGHDFQHTMRVYKNALEIYEIEKTGDKFIIECSALLHDIADHKFGYNDNDRRKIILEILNNYSIEKEKIEKIIDIVNTISFSKGKIVKSIEGKIVQDADRLDALGAIGIARAFIYGGSIKSDLNEVIKHFYDKLFLLKDRMNTKTAKEIAKTREKFMYEFIKRLDREIKINL
ncbi:uncharacterized protein EV215_1317 [Hypnocyclicus thermotrophus]|uniref:HD domain-containing protein n=1 Tax=Hypnocyclicus thermotrophus TaxID=1627895 RepID=A0AA46I5B8_9FUSO|nr:HD domain-containing protein [Hypnocyclicus thermotrophus]TDT69778.1 uncharacterized protein EV215_1317 [Hypnocyclicus thermotrophus]